MNEAAEKLFKEAVEEHPQLHEAAYSLGLLLVERKKYQDAVKYLRKAANGMPNRARIHYNLGLLLQQVGQWDEAEITLRQALKLDPDAMDYLHAMADHYLRRGHLEAAARISERMVVTHPNNPLGIRILEFIKKELNRRRDQ